MHVYVYTHTLSIYTHIHESVPGLLLLPQCNYIFVGLYDTILATVPLSLVFRICILVWISFFGNSLNFFHL